MSSKIASILLVAGLGAACAPRSTRAPAREQPSPEACAEQRDVAADRAELRREFLGLEAPSPIASREPRGANIDMELQLRLNPGTASAASGSPGLSMARAVDNAGRTILPYDRPTWDRETVGRHLQQLERRAAELPTAAACEAAGFGSRR